MSDFVDEIASQGFLPPRHIVWDGKIHRFPTSPEKPHSKDGWYVAHDDAIGKAGAFGSMRDAVKHTWGNGSGRQLTAAELRAIDAQREEEKKRAVAAKKSTALRAQRIYAQASDSGISDYLKRKKMDAPEGCKFVSLLDSTAFGFHPERPWHITGLIVPMRNHEGEIVNLQIIPNGSDKKFFMPESQTTGTFHLIGGEISDRVVIAEGIATAQAILPRSHCPVAAAFSASNLPSVARILRAKHPNAEIIMAADGDKPGREYAQKAIQGLAGQNRVIEAPDGQDFWDVPFPDLAPSMDRSTLFAQLLKKTLDDGTEGKVLPRIANYTLILSHAPEFAGKLRHNIFSDSAEWECGPILDDVVTNTTAAIERDWVPDRVAPGEVERSMRAAAKTRQYHPVVDYLRGTKWDGEDRIDHFFQDHLACPDTPYISGTARALFIGAVRRILFPGCQMDHMVVLESDQGRKKSSLWGVLAGDWYLDQTASIESVDFFIALRGKWFVDLGELSQFKNAEVTRIKQILTLRHDDYRPKYGRDNQRFPRQCIFVGGTNETGWIGDQTGGRRFLPVPVLTSCIDTDAVAAIRDQIFAEAVHRVDHGDWLDWWDIPGAQEEQSKRIHGDFWEAPIARFLTEDFTGQTITGAEIMAKVMRKDLGNTTIGDERKVGGIMDRLGWTRKKVRYGSKVCWAYARPQQ